MFGNKDKCLCNDCCHSSVSTAMIHVQYSQKICQLEAELCEDRHIIKDLTETNKYLSKIVARNSASNP